MHSYDERYDPPAPMAMVSLSDESGGAIVSGIWMLMDSGADATLLPRSAIEKAGWPFSQGEEIQLRGYDGKLDRVPVVQVDVLFLRRRYRGLYPVVEGEEGVLGRDILNQIVLVLDGPAGQWAERQPV